MKRDGDQGDSPEGTTELDVRLPSKIAMSHEDGELEERETLPVVQLPDGEQLEGKVAPVLSPMPEADRSTEVVDLPKFRKVKKAEPQANVGKSGLPAPLLLLIGVILGAGAALLIVYLFILK